MVIFPLILKARFWLKSSIFATFSVKIDLKAIVEISAFAISKS
jgi:hypothetical protein